MIGKKNEMSNGDELLKENVTEEGKIMKEYLTQERTDKLFNIITANGCREMEEDRFHQAVNEAISISNRLVKPEIADTLKMTQRKETIISDKAEVETIIGEFIKELKDKTVNHNPILFGINGHKILALMELKERINAKVYC